MLPDHSGAFYAFSHNIYYIAKAQAGLQILLQGLTMVSYKSNLNDLTAIALQNAVLGHPDSWVKSWFVRRDQGEICLSAWTDAYLTCITYLTYTTQKKH